MFLRRGKQSGSGRENEYTTCAELADIFAHDMDRLYSLALLLTGDHPSAEYCFGTALECCTEGHFVFKQSAASWSRRSVVKSAIKMISPTSGGSDTSCLPYDHIERSVESEVPLFEVQSLPVFDRFVFVMTFLEGYSDRECSLLLSCAIGDILPARIRAVQQISITDEKYCPEPRTPDGSPLPDADWLECGGMSFIRRR
jgi:hypothetical protein